MLRAASEIKVGSGSSATDDLHRRVNVLRTGTSSRPKRVVLPQHRGDVLGAWVVRDHGNEADRLAPPPDCDRLRDVAFVDGDVREVGARVAKVGWSGARWLSGLREPRSAMSKHPGSGHITWPIARMTCAISQTKWPIARVMRTV